MENPWIARLAPMTGIKLVNCDKNLLLVPQVNSSLILIKWVF